MKKIILIHLFVASFILFSCQSETKETPNKKPNIIFIMADDLGYADLGSYGQELIQTPHLDKMASEEITLTNVYAGSPVCAPSRSVLMTGMHTGHTTVRGNFGATGVTGLGGGEGRVPLKENDITVAEVLKKAGYITGMSGKWGLGEPNTTGHPNDQGFDEFFGYLNQRRAHDYYVDYLWHNREKVELPGNKDGKEETYSHTLITDFALNFIKENKDTSFFLYLPYTLPHDEYEVPDLAPYQNEEWGETEKIYAAMVTLMDSDIGRMMDTLKHYGIDKNTIVFFCSDNGAAQRWEGRFNSSGKLRGRKRDLFEGGIRTPMIVRYPEKIKANQSSDVPWYFPDVLPTLAQLAEVEEPDGLDGQNILPLLLGEPYSAKNRYFYWEFHENGYQQAVRWNQWKYLRLSPNKTGIELYDLETDPSEEHNIIGEHPEIVREIEKYLKTARTKSVDWPVE